MHIIKQLVSAASRPRPEGASPNPAKRKLNRYAPMYSGGQMICHGCQELERLCIIHLWSLRQSSIVQSELVIKLHDSFPELLESAKNGCHACRCWANALMNECSTRGALNTLMRSERPITASSPTTSVSHLRAGVSELRFGHYFKIQSEVEVIMRLCEISSVQFEALTNHDDSAQFSVARKWLAECHDSHLICSEISDPRDAPTRLLDVSSPHPKLVDGAFLEGASYVALSYCWGGDQSTKLTLSNEKDFRDGMPLLTFSKTIQDAVSVCQQLEVNYLWVDALCIFQDGDTNDWENEASKIHRIYGNAFVTLSICSAESAQDGFLANHWSNELQVDPRRAKIAGMLAVPARKTFARIQSESPLARRGWIFQEQLLSPRMLHWSDQGLFWSCSKATHAENGAAERDELFPQMVGPETFNPHEFRRSKDPLALWDDMIATFSTRDFTVQTDRLPAVSGLASLINQATADEYYQGLWESRLPGQLLWMLPRKSIPTAEHGNWQGKDGFLPSSWSWASIPPARKIVMPKQTSSRASFRRCVQQENMCRLEVNGRTRNLIQDLTHTEYPEEELVDGENLRFPALRDQANVWAFSKEKGQILVALDWKRPIVISLDHGIPESFEDLLCLEITYIGMLLLQPIQMDGELMYERLGCAQAHREPGFFDKAEKSTVTLI